MATKRSRAEWEQLVAKLDESGESVGRFADAHGLNRNTLAWWRWQTRSTASRVERVGFVPVVMETETLLPSVGAVGFEAALPNGVVLRFEQLGIAQLHRVIAALAEI